MSEQPLPPKPLTGKPETVSAKVIEALPNAMFRVVFADGTDQIAYLGGKMKFHRIKVLIGDRVEVLLEPYGGKGRITKRL